MRLSRIFALAACLAAAVATTGFTVQRAPSWHRADTGVTARLRGRSRQRPGGPGQRQGGTVIRTVDGGGLAVGPTGSDISYDGGWTWHRFDTGSRRASRTALACPRRK
jgi:hypothetical protein